MCNVFQIQSTVQDVPMELTEEQHTTTKETTKSASPTNSY